MALLTIEGYHEPIENLKLPKEMKKAFTTIDFTDHKKVCLTSNQLQGEISTIVRSTSGGKIWRHNMRMIRRWEFLEP